VLNNAYRLRGEDVFSDMSQEPARASHLFECIAATMKDAMTRLCARQQASGVTIRHCTVSNCLVNMVSPKSYRELLLPFDLQFAATFGLIGIHNCAWTADAYLEDYARVPNVGYIDMGLHSDLPRAKALFPHARRAVMYTPMDLQNKSLAEIRADVERIAAEYAPCDLVLADIDSTTPDQRVLDVAAMCAEIRARHL
jgi:hypothetical protein